MVCIIGKTFVSQESYIKLNKLLLGWAVTKPPLWIKLNRWFLLYWL